MLNEWKLLSFNTKFLPQQQSTKSFPLTRKNTELNFSILNCQFIFLKKEKRENKLLRQNLDFPFTMLLKVQSTWKPETLQRLFCCCCCSKGLPLNKHSAITKKQNQKEKWTKKRKSFFSVWEMNFNEFCWRWTNRRKKKHKLYYSFWLIEQSF